jgi:anti-sigma-K factor RskA
MTDNTHEFGLLLGAHALGALDGDERRAVELHLQTCQSCNALLVELRSVAVGVALAADPIEPPPVVKARLLARVTGEDLPRALRPPDAFAPRSPGRRASDLAVHRSAQQQSKSPAWRLAAAAAVILAAATGVYAWLLQEQVADMRTTVERTLAHDAALASELGAARRDAAQLVRIADVLGAPDMLKVELRGQATAPEATGRAFLSPSQGLVLDARRLPALAAGRVYQLWMIAAGTPVSAGVLSMGADGAATIAMPMPAGVPMPSSLAVTVEPAGGSTTPTMPMVLMGETKTP